MLFHMSIAAREPERTAHALAELWQGKAYPFPPVGGGSWIAMAGDERNSAIEVYPLGTELYFEASSAEFDARSGTPDREGPCHAAIGTPLDTDQVLALAARENWPARVSDRGPFTVIEMWIDGSFMFEVLTAEMRDDYLRNVTIEGWEAWLAANGADAS